MLDGKLTTLTRSRAFARSSSGPLRSYLADVRPIGEGAREAAFTQVMNYFRQNQEEMHDVSRPRSTYRWKRTATSSPARWTF